MPKFVELHQRGEPVLVNPLHVVTVGPNAAGTWIAVAGDNAVTNVDESYKQVKAKLEQA